MASPPAACAAGATATHARAATATAVNTIVGREVLRPAPATALACDEVMPRPSPPPPLQPRPARWPVSRAERSHALPRRAIQAHHRRAIGLRHPPPPKEFTWRRGGRWIYKELSGGRASPKARGGKAAAGAGAGRRIRITADRAGGCGCAGEGMRWQVGLGHHVRQVVDLAAARERACAGRGAGSACNAVLAADTRPKSRRHGMRQWAHVPPGRQATRPRCRRQHAARDGRGDG